MTTPKKKPRNKELTDEQKEVLEFIQSLKAKTTSKPRKSIKGMWTNLKFEITEQEIIEAKHEIWSNFPKDIELNFMPHRQREI